MRAIFLLLVLGLAAVAAEKGFDRIVGGSVTNIESYPSIAALLFSSTGSSYSQTCVGTVINNRSILTAAHCLYGYSTWQWRIRVSSTNANSGGVVHNTHTAIIHPSYNIYENNNDIAILHSATAFDFNNHLRAAIIAGANYNLADNQAVWAAGWGATSMDGMGSEQLRHVQIWTVNQDNCRSRYNVLAYTVTDNMLCAGGLESAGSGRVQCQGDYGGPLYHNNVLVGVASWGEGCALARYPGVNTRVSRYTAWIQSNA